jgi:hypothetical protein
MGADGSTHVLANSPVKGILGECHRYSIPSGWYRRGATRKRLDHADGSSYRVGKVVGVCAHRHYSADPVNDLLGKPTHRCDDAGAAGTGGEGYHTRRGG